MIRAVRARKEDRHSNPREKSGNGRAERATVAFRKGKFSVAVLDVSRQGARLESDLLPQIDERIAIQFEGCNPVDCLVRWVRDGQIGIEFAEETALLMPHGGVIPTPAAPRPVQHRAPKNGAGYGAPRPEVSGQPASSAKAARPPRQRVMWQGTLYWDGGSAAVSLRNISSGGAMVAGFRNLKPGVEVVLALKSAGTVPGTVRWCRAGQIGLRFERAFDVTKLLDPRKTSRGPAPSSTRPGILKPLYLESELDTDSPWAARWEKLRPQDLG